VSLTAVEFFLVKTVRCIDFCENGPKMMCRMADCCHFQACVVAKHGEGGLIWGGNHGDREKAGTGTELFVLWAGTGFSWKSGAGGAQGGASGEKVQEELCPSESGGVRGCRPEGERTGSGDTV